MCPSLSTCSVPSAIWRTSESQLDPLFPRHRQVQARQLVALRVRAIEFVVEVSRQVAEARDQQPGQFVLEASEHRKECVVGGPDGGVALHVLPLLVRFADQALVSHVEGSDVLACRGRLLYDASPHKDALVDVPSAVKEAFAFVRELLSALGLRPNRHVGGVHFAGK